MSQLHFINLAIDQLLDPDQNLQKIFSVRIPQSENLIRIHENLALFLTNQDDLSLQYQLPSKALREYYKQRGCDLGQAVAILANPFDTSLWIKEVKEKLAGLKFETLSTCGMSKLEIQLAKLLSISFKPKLSEDLFKELNKKTYLIHLADQLNINTPETQVLKTPDLFRFLSHLDKPTLIKASWSSGGGGNMLIESKDATLMKHLLRHENELSLDFEWLAQKPVKRKMDWSVVANTENSDDIIYQVEYDTYGHSFRHRIEKNSQIVSQMKHVSQMIRQHLLKKEYHGPFGFDGFEDLDGQLYPAIDLNVRFTKTHLIHQASQRLHLKKSCDAIRVRFQGQGATDGEQIFHLLKGLVTTQSTENEFVPYNLGGLMGESSGVKEISYFVSPDPDWQKFVKIKIEKIFGVSS